MNNDTRTEDERARDQEVLDLTEALARKAEERPFAPAYTEDQVTMIREKVRELRALIVLES